MKGFLEAWPAFKWDLMLDLDLMRVVAVQMMDGDGVAIGGKVIPVKQTTSHKLKFVQFAMNGREYQAIEQNAAKPSRWGELARQGHRVVQFRDLCTGKYVAVSVDGQVTEYGR
jgi:hypothetical protein